ncbi:hypothetical protein Taro_021437, partial [Colocasia esculenta]|nr:hypothetical protein [Colocasia esculenta]
TVANPDPNPVDVEELLCVAQNNLLLKLNVDMHTTTTSSSLDPDLSRRFDALRSHCPPPLPKRESPSDGPSNLLSGEQGGATAAGTSDAVEEKEEGEVRARKTRRARSSETTLRPGFPPSRTRIFPISLLIPKEVDDDNDGEDHDRDESDDGGDRVPKKEVEKLMRWAMDAACLDVVPTNNDDEEGIREREEKASDQNDDDEEDDPPLCFLLSYAPTAECVMVEDGEEGVGGVDILAVGMAPKDDGRKMGLNSCTGT